MEATVLLEQELVYLTVPVRSLYLVALCFSLTEEEKKAIVYYDGQYVGG